MIHEIEHLRTELSLVKDAYAAVSAELKSLRAKVTAISEEGQLRKEIESLRRRVSNVESLTADLGTLRALADKMYEFAQIQVREG